MSQGSEDPFAPIEKELLQLLSMPRIDFELGVELLCGAHPHWTSRIREWAAARLLDTRFRHEETGSIRADDAAPPSHFGPFAILSEIGHGGMGTVYLAEQKTPVNRRVALKVIKLGMDTKGVLARFETERQALALMNHSSIAKVYEAGATPEGRPYFAMEYVKGIPITRYCDDNALSIEERLELFRQVCSGVQHAHTKGVIHRDLTPNNVLVTVQDDKAVAKIIDFGLARATDHRLTEKTVFTERGVILGTPEYMSPEQAGLNALDIDMRSDVYTLGVLLYELLTGKLPFSNEQLRGAGYDKMCAIIRTEEPDRPSTKITKQARDTAEVARRRRTEPAALLRRLRGDLDWIVIKCLEKDRIRRYETVSELAADVRRHLEYEPVMARAPSFAYRLTKMARRYRGQLAAVAAIFVALLGGLAAATYFWLDAAAQAERADTARLDALHQAGEAKRLAAIATDNEGLARTSAAQALARKREFDLLAGVPYLELALETEATLYPPEPTLIEAMRAWLREDAGRLLEMRREIVVALHAIRDQALPATPEDLDRDRTTHPRYAELQQLTAKLVSLARAHAIRNGNELIVSEPTAEERAMPSGVLSAWASRRVSPDDAKRTWGEEARALMLARIACDKQGPPGGAESELWRRTLAWAWFANGKDDEAIAVGETVMAAMSEDRKAVEADFVTELKAKVEAVAGERGAAALAALRQEVAALDVIVGTRRTYRFRDEPQRFLHDTLQELDRNLSQMENNELVAVRKRLEWAERIGELTRGHPDARKTWAETRDAIARADNVVASELYREQAIALRDEDVIGLVPIGMNPATKLWEFYHLRSAWDGTGDPAMLRIPRHVTEGDRVGHIEVGDDTGIVFALLPGGTFTMGAQATNPEGANYDARASDNEAPNQVTLSPFFLARHEVTQAQWGRLTDGPNPSQYYPGYVRGGQCVTAANPVERVDWVAASLWMARHGLALPTEAQWEYGCRAGTTTPWWTGNDRETLRGAVNLSDLTAKKNGAPWPCDWPELDDGFVLHAPVSTLRANAFGLHHVHGNVSEWCADRYEGYPTPTRPGDGLRDGRTPQRSFRGATFDGAAMPWTRCAIRERTMPETRALNIGLRAARVLGPMVRVSLRPEIDADASPQGR